MAYNICSLSSPVTRMTCCSRAYSPSPPPGRAASVWQGRIRRLTLIALHAPRGFTPEQARRLARWPPWKPPQSCGHGMLQRWQLCLCWASSHYPANGSARPGTRASPSKNPREAAHAAVGLWIRVGRGRACPSRSWPSSLNPHPRCARHSPLPPAAHPFQGTAVGSSPCSPCRRAQGSPPPGAPWGLATCPAQATSCPGSNPARRRPRGAGRPAAPPGDAAPADLPSLRSAS
mmetsp:Transcript_139992/g.314319  ORF Transcript_139992/g.314319 Transcript_139992/m.314319 type:complete len:232 (+) Transcript_139992:812-1507(+)